MRFETEINLLKRQVIDDGMGGVIETDIYGTYWTFFAFKLPVKVENLLEEYGLTSTKAVKLITRDHIPDDILLLQEPHNDMQKYELLQLMDYGKFKMLLVEEVD